MTHWDVVIVGAGSAGAALAGRLSEDSARRVLLLEAGPDHTAAQTPDGVWGKHLFDAISAPGRIWPSLTAVPADGRAPTPYLRGRGVGGSSAVNAQVAIRGLPNDYDRWAASGCPGWDAEGTREAFARVAQRIPAERTPQAQWSAFDRALLGASLALGHPRCESYETEGVVGVSPVGLTRRGGRRVSTNDAYLEPARGRTNLEIRGDALVDRVVVKTGRATGVRTLDGEIGADHVVISAGAIHSPAILLRSGLGAVRPGLGRNLCEHPRLAATLVVRPEIAAAGMNSPSTGCLLRWSSRVAGSGEGDLQILALNHTDRSAPATVTLLAAVMEPFSRGSVTLASDDPEVDPHVAFRLLSHPADASRMRLAAREMMALLEHPLIADIASSISLDAAGTKPGDLTDTALDGWIAGQVSDYVHAAGTCRMGSPDDPAAVVDPLCRFIGVEALSVVDASIMPVIPRANTHLTAVMIAEKAAEMMLR